MPYHRPIPERESKPKENGGLHSFVEAEKLMQIAFLLPSAVLVGWLGGAWLGHIFHLKWMMMAGILLGCVSGLVVVIRQAMAAEKASYKADETPSDGKNRKDGDS
jgi:F0F1-type ATP synthase assembly protein I